MKASLHHLCKTQCLIDGSAFFFIRSNNNPFYGQDGGRVDPGCGEKLLAKMKLYGPQYFRVTIEFTSTDNTQVEARLAQILKEVDGHPLSLNFSSQELVERRRYECTEETRKLHRDNVYSIGRVLDPANVQKWTAAEAEANRNTKWIHNPKTRVESKIKVGMALPEGFVFGRFYRRKRKKNRKRPPKLPRFMELAELAKLAITKPTP